MLPSISLKLSKKLGTKMGESKVLEEILDKLFMGGMTLAGLDPTNGLLIPKVNSWSKGGCWALGVVGNREQEGCAEWPGLPEEFLLQPGNLLGSQLWDIIQQVSRKNHPKIQILGLARLEKIRWQCRKLGCGVTLAAGAAGTRPSRSFCHAVLSLHLP